MWLLFKKIWHYIIKNYIILNNFYKENVITLANLGIAIVIYKYL